jgi:REase_MTES_1575
MRALEEKRWVVHPQVGVSFFRIDLGVVHPDFPGRYLAGIECDGAAYHRSATARDRGRLREMILSDLGWRIRRIWSTDWWMDAASAMEKLHTKLTRDIESDRQSRATQPAASEKNIPEPAAITSAPDGVAHEPENVLQTESNPVATITLPPLIPRQSANDDQIEEIKKTLEDLRPTVRPRARST